MSYEITKQRFKIRVQVVSEKDKREKIFEKKYDTIPKFGERHEFTHLASLIEL